MVILTGTYGKGIMKKKYVYITAEERFEDFPRRNPIRFLDHKLEHIYPEFYVVDYDLRLLATEVESDLRGYHDIWERHGDPDIEVLADAAKKRPAKNVFLNGFRQEHLEYIAPYIKDTVEVLYFFKCPKIKDLSVLSEFKELRCVLIFWNNALETLWDMSTNTKLKVISFEFVTKLREIETLKKSSVEYATFDSADNCGNRKEMLFDRSVFADVPKLKHLTLAYKYGEYISY